MTVREIKFRGMDLQGRWFYGNYAVLHKDLRSTGNKAGHYISNSAGAPFAYAVRPETVGQYTGLHDDGEVGEELYDGDIVEVELEDEVYTAWIKHEGCGFMIVSDALPDGYMWLSDIVDADRKYWWAEGTRKIGNIHEQKELVGA